MTDLLPLSTSILIYEDVSPLVELTSWLKFGILTMKKTANEASALLHQGIWEWYAFSVLKESQYQLIALQGKVFSTVWSPDDPLTLAAAGSKAKLQIWDVSSNFGARKAFGGKLREAGKTLKENSEGKGGVIGITSDDEESDDGGDED